MASEIERAFLVERLPEDLALGPGVHLRQGYLAEEAGTQVRLRITDAGATLAIKGAGGLVRTEVELPVPPEDAEVLWGLTAGRRIDKVRHRVELDGATTEVDVYAGGLEGLVRAEVEFPSEQAARGFTPPAWFELEVTDDPRWGNASLARHGRPG
jgi:adenylate cyclase